MARSLNRVQLIGNLTRDPELRYTPAGNAVCTFGLATNRSWTTDAGEKREEVDFHRIVAWNKLAELCSQFLVKGRKVYVEGRLSTRNWTAQDGSQKSTTEVVIDDMILLDKQGGTAGAAEHSGPEESFDPEEMGPAEKPKRPAAKKEEAPTSTNKDDEVAPDDIPF
jgi:single-strand DNA-binding protein